MNILKKIRALRPLLIHGAASHPSRRIACQGGRMVICARKKINPYEVRPQLQWLNLIN